MDSRAGAAQIAGPASDQAPPARMNPDAPEAAFVPPHVVEEPPGLAIPFVFNVPHAGDVYPADFLAAARLDALALRRSEDAFVDRLIAGVTALGAPLMRARFPRAYLDVNREPYELDPRMFEGRLPSYANTRSLRVAGGLGTVPRVVADGQDIYRGRIPVDVALARIEALYKPYHRALRGLVHRTARGFGHVVLVDCHSMPASSLGRDEAKRDSPSRVDVVLGDRYGTSCAGALTDVAEAAFAQAGFRVVRNRPYAGGFITEHYGEPSLGRHALQVEINRGLYMDERALAEKPGFSALGARLVGVFAEIATAWAAETGPRRMAAE